ncbi:DNA-binding NarL/FixJ family response regulator [Crossiella equi]|uniref:DNA-binding NarL/FixJ family response regulator n=1 Tax=Crossiella equi TaxID=130796 RepID=A0ABS5ABK7_9PSEU|nr:response regulator transcription factor [Crossiella equi]MBP2473975.1 DNA-binding NarL/FixJ family response regulator [Crossiella equi]
MRLILAEDSILLREGLIRLLVEEGHEVVAAVGTGEELLAAVAAEQPEVCVVDVRMPPTHTSEGVRAALRIREHWPEVGVLMLSQYVEQRYATQLLAAGSRGIGYLLKDRVTQVDTFLDALAKIATGGAVFDPEVVSQLLSRTTHTDPLTTLTPREHDVLRHMAEGHTNAGIGKTLHISQSAVEKHINAIFDKLALTPITGYNRRTLAILRYLGS